MPDRSKDANDGPMGTRDAPHPDNGPTRNFAFTEARRHPCRFGYFWGIASPLICTLIDWPLRHWLGPASILMTYLLGVFLVASHFGRGASLVASLLSAPLFAFYFARPIFSVAIHDLENIIALAVMIVVANVTGRLVEKSRLQAGLATQRERRADALYRLSRDLSGAQDFEAVARIGARHVRDVFGASSILFIADDRNRLQVPSSDPLPKQLENISLAEAQRRYDEHALSCEAGLAYYPLKSAGVWPGLLVVETLSGLREQNPERAAFLDTFCNLIAQTLERLQLAAQAREATLLAETEALRNALLTSISHDLRTPLTRIIGAASTLIEDEAQLSAEDRKEFNQDVLDEAQRMSDLTGKLLDMARLSSGEIILHQDWNAIEEIVGSALNRLDRPLQNRPVRTVLPNDLPLLWIDAVLIEQVLVNLIENAVKYSQAGSPIDIGAQVHGRTLLLTVADYGPGIPVGQEGRIFEKFYRGNAAESDRHGVGLGLTLCKAIVEAHGGTIRACNRSGKGAEFTVTLPLRDPPGLNGSELGETPP